MVCQLVRRYMKMIFPVACRSVPFGINIMPSPFAAQRKRVLLRSTPMDFPWKTRDFDRPYSLLLAWRGGGGFYFFLGAKHKIALSHIIDDAIGKGTGQHDQIQAEILID